MATLPVINGIHRAAFTWRVGATGPLAVNVMHFFNASSDPTGCFNALNTNVTTGMWAGIALGTSVVQVAITPLDGSTATGLFFPSGAKWAGSNTAGEYSLHTAAVVSFKTAKRGRRYRGRIYLPFILESQMASGSFTAAPTAATTAWEAFRTAMTTSSFPLHIASYGHSLHRTKSPGGGYVLTPVTWTPTSDPVTSCVVEATFATQRRRQTRLRA